MNRFFGHHPGTGDLMETGKLLVRKLKPVVLARDNGF